MIQSLSTGTFRGTYLNTAARATVTIPTAPINMNAINMNADWMLNTANIVAMKIMVKAMYNAE